MKLSLPWLHLVCIWFIGISASILCYSSVYRYETQKLNTQVTEQIERHVRSAKAAMEHINQEVKLALAYISSDDSITPAQFDRFLKQAIAHESKIKSILWAPKVPVAQKHIFESQARSQGLLGYSVFPQIDHKTRSTFDSNSLFPTYFVSPMFEGSDWLGFRLESNDNLAEKMRRPHQLNKTFTASYNAEGHAAVHILLPKLSSTHQLEGVVAAQVVIHELLGAIWSSQINSEQVGITVTNPSNGATLFETHINTELKGDELESRLISASSTVRIEPFQDDWTITISMLDRTGSTVYYSSTLIVLTLLLTAIVTLAANFYAKRLQVSEIVIKEKTKELEHQAIRDKLTQLYNRTALEQELNKQLSHIQLKMIEGFTVVFIDLDRFKQINDSMGHIHGDTLLQMVAQRIKKHCRNKDKCFRFGGDEFVICLPDITSQTTLTNVCQRYLSALNKPYVIDGQQCCIGASIGVSIVAEPSQSLANVLRKADIAMYKAKSSTSQKVVFFQQEMLQGTKRRFILEQDLLNAIELKQVFLVYQPIYHVDSDNIKGFEALLRWNHPTLGMIPPQEFIEIAEQTGQILQIGDWVIREACRALNRLWQLMPKEQMPRININVSAKQFESCHVLNTLQEVLVHTHFPPHLLGIEITESTLLQEQVDKKSLYALKEMGLVLYLDDFGTGYSSLAVLNQYPIDVLKIDRSFVSAIACGQESSDALCEAIAKLAKTMNMKSVAEGVETDAQLAYLRRYGYNYIQGYLKSKPVSICQLESLIMAQIISSETRSDECALIVSNF